MSPSYPPPAARGLRWAPSVAGSGHSGDATVTEKRLASCSLSAHVRGPARASRSRTPGLGSREGPGGGRQASPRVQRVLRQGLPGKVCGLRSWPPTAKAMASKFLRAVILGPPGSGKGTVCERIAQNFGLQHLSSGHLLRENLKTSTEVGDVAKQYLEKGLLVPDHVITRLMMSELETRSAQHWLLDGFPRTLVQAEALDRICDVDLVISLNIPFETLKDRLSRRWIHPSSGRVYNLDFNPPQVLGIDDITGEPLVQQEDDKPEAVAAKLRRYKDAAKPVIELYKSRGVLHQFSGTETNRIWPYVYTLFSNKITPIQSKEAY